MNENQIINVEAEEAPIVEYTDFGDIVTAAEKYVGAMNRVRVTAMKLTREKDWVLMAARSGPPKPYLQGTGAEAVARAFGVRISKPLRERIEGTDRNGKPYYGYVFMATFSLKDGTSIEAMGARQSNEAFFANQNSEAPERDVMMAAYTNLMVNGVTRLLGIRNITLDELQEAGLDPRRMPGVTFKEPGGSSGATDSGTQEKEQASTEDRSRLASYIRMVAGKDQDRAADILQELTAFKEYQGRRSLKGAFSKKACSMAIGKIKEAIDTGKYEVGFNASGDPIEE